MMRPEPSTGPVHQTPSDDLPWWLKYGVRLVAIVSSLAALVLGVVACVSFAPRCILAGIIQMLIGLLVALIEAPFLCMFLDFAQIPSTYFDAKPPWFRGLLYVIVSIIPISLCSGLSTFFGSGLVFLAGSLYGLMSLRRNKPPVENMGMQASSSYNLLQNSRAAGDVETGSMQPRPMEKQSGVI